MPEVPSILSSSLATLQVRCVAASSKTRPVTVDARGIPSTRVRNLLRASRDRLTKRQQERLREAFVADEAHISVEVAYLHRASARGLPSRHTRPRPTPGRSSHREPTKVSHPRDRSPGPDPTQIEGRTRRLLRHRRSKQRTPQKPSTDIIELGRRTARGYRNPTNNQLRMLLTTADLDASPHTPQLLRASEGSASNPSFVSCAPFWPGFASSSSEYIRAEAYSPNSIRTSRSVFLTGSFSEDKKDVV